MIRVKGRPEAVASSAAVSLLNCLKRSGVAIDTVCGGRAQCGRCLIRVLSGGNKLNRRNEREAARLGALQAGEDLRLACQTYTRGDIEIEIIHKGSSGA